MNFLLPGAFALAALGLVILALYFLKLRRVEHRVSSVYLWRKMVQDREASAPWQRLRFNWLLILQLLFLGFVVVALARPYIWKDGISGQSVIIILDSSASMSAVDVIPNRFEAARKRARQIINELPQNSRLTIIDAGNETQVLLTSSQDRAHALNALEDIQPGTGQADLEMALELASAIASRHSDTQIVLLSDGGSPISEDLALHGMLNYLPVGIDGNNQAISLLNIESSPAGGWSLFVQVSNYHDEPEKRRLAVFADGYLVQAIDMDLPAKDNQSVIFSDLPQNMERIEVELEGDDGLALDDRAYLVVRSIQPQRVALVSNGNLFLKTALRLLPGIELAEVDPASMSSIEADVIVYDGMVPEGLPDRGNLWFIAPDRSTDLFSVSGELEVPELRILDAEDFFASDLSMVDIHLLDSRRMSLPDWGVPVFSGDVGDGSFPLLFRGEPDGRRVAVLAFDLNHSDLPLNVAFPVLCANIMSWLAPNTSLDVPASILPGEHYTLPQGVHEVSLSYPNGSKESIEINDDRLVLLNTHQTGFYDVYWDDEQHVDFAVNLFLPQESNIKPLESLSLLSGRSGAGGEDRSLAQMELWRWLAMPALLILMLEWIYFYRGGLKRIRDGLRKWTSLVRSRRKMQG